LTHDLNRRSAAGDDAAGGDRDTERDAAAG